MTIHDEELMDLLLKKFPKLKSYWEPFIAYWGTDQGITTKVMPFSDYIVDVIKTDNDAEIKIICELIEHMIIHGDNGVEAAMKTIILEDLLNRDPKEIQFKKFAHHMGKESIEYCKYWNKFCGCKTEGIDY